MYICALKKERKKIKVNEKAVLKQEKLKAKCKSQQKMDMYLHSFSHFPNEYDVEGVQIMVVGRVDLQIQIQQKKMTRFNKRNLNTTSLGLIQKLKLGNS